MAKKLTAQKKAPRVVDPASTPYKLRFGTRNEMGPEHRFPTIPKAKQKARAELDDLVVWCTRHNQAGLKAVSDAMAQLDGLTFNSTRQRLECTFDERYSMRLVIEYWRENA